MDLEDAGMRVKLVRHDRDASFTAANELGHGTLDRPAAGVSRWTGPWYGISGI
jgi:hypothetical protein